MATQQKASKIPLTESEIKASAEKLAATTNLVEQVDQAGARLAIIESAKIDFIPKKGEKSTQDILNELGL